MKKITFLLAFVLCNYHVSAQIVQNGLVAHFPLNGNADDISSLNIDGTNFNTAPTTGQSGLAGTALFFDPTQGAYINAGTNTRGITNAVTMSAWIKTAYSGTQRIIDTYNWPGDEGYYIEVYQNKAIIAGRDGSGNFIYPGLGTTTVNDGEWHHVVGIVNGNTWQIWVDCNMENYITTNTSNPSIASTYPLIIGSYYYGMSNADSRHFSGSIDEVRIYNRALSAAEIDSLCKYSEPSSVVLVEKNDVFSVYPNPSKGQIKIDFNNSIDPSEYSILIYNQLGELVQSNPLESTVNIERLNNGVYFLNIINEDGALLKAEILIKQ